MVMGFNHGSLLELMSEIEGLERTIDGRKGGITNKRYRVRTSQGHDLVVRLFGRQTEIFIDRKVEPVQRALIDPKESGHSPSDPIRVRCQFPGLRNFVIMLDSADHVLQ